MNVTGNNLIQIRQKSRSICDLLIWHKDLITFLKIKLTSAIPDCGFSSPEHIVLKVSFSDRWMSIVGQFLQTTSSPKLLSQFQ